MRPRRNQDHTGRGQRYRELAAQAITRHHVCGRDLEESIALAIHQAVAELAAPIAPCLDWKADGQRAVLLLLNRRSGLTWSEIVRGAGLHPRNTTTLQALVQRGLVRRSRRGRRWVYRLPIATS